MTAKDYFSSQSASYRAFRPHYPPELFQYLCRNLSSTAVVWDCATGSGQAANALRKKANCVVASDLSAQQLAEAPRVDGVFYVQAIAENLPIADRTFELVTIAQALHWFDFPRFYAEVDRVLKPGGAIAAWTYSFLAVSSQLGDPIDEVVRWFYHDVVGPYWPPERRWVDEQYRSIPFPFAEVDPPEFHIRVSWDLASIVGYISSWSAVARFTEATGRDPMPEFFDNVRVVWGDAEARRELDWPISMRIGVKP